MTGSANRSWRATGIALCVSAAAHLVLLSAATILLRVPQIPVHETPGALSIVGISEILNQDTSSASRTGTLRSAPAVRAAGAPASSSMARPSETVPQAAPRPQTQPLEEPRASSGDSGPAKGDAEAAGVGGTAAGTAPGNGPAAPQTASPGSQGEFLSQDKVTDVPVIPAGEVLARIEYPPLAARQGIEAVVYLELFIDEQGRVRRVNVLKDPGYGFAEAAVRALSGVLCTPAKVGGHSVAVRFRFPVRFSLN